MNIAIVCESAEKLDNIFKYISFGEITRVSNSKFIIIEDETNVYTISNKDKLLGKQFDQIFTFGEIYNFSKRDLYNATSNSCVPLEYKIQTIL